MQQDGDIFRKVETVFAVFGFGVLFLGGFNSCTDTLHDFNCIIAVPNHAAYAHAIHTNRWVCIWRDADGWHEIEETSNVKGK